MLQKFDDNVTRAHHSIDLFDDWETLKDEYPKLYQLSTIIFGIPPTQVTVERSFSAMALIFNPKRGQLRQKLLEDILTIKLNKELIHDINVRDMQALKSQ